MVTANLPRRAPIRYFLLLCDVLRRDGVDTDHLLHLAGIDPAVFEDREGMLNSVEVENFIVAARKITGRDDLGFETGQCIKMNSHSLLGYGLISCSTVDQFLRMGSCHYHLIQETWNMSYRRNSAGMGECLYTPLVALSPATLRFSLETLAQAHQNHLKLLLGSHTPSYDIYLSMPEPAHIHRYQLLRPVRFHFVPELVPGVRVVMPSAMLDLPLAMGDERVMREIDAYCKTLRKKIVRTEVAWTEYVLMVLREARGARVTMEFIAKRVQVSPRTIDRYLKKDGQSFRKLSDRVRFERACHMLREHDATVADVAALLGFSDAPNFTRAFRRVVGIPPGEYQKTALQGSGSEFLKMG